MGQRQETEKYRTPETWQEKEKRAEKLMAKWDEWGVDKTIMAIRKKFWPDSCIGHRQVVLAPKVHRQSWRETTIAFCQKTEPNKLTGVSETLWYQLCNSNKNEELSKEGNTSIAYKAWKLRLAPGEYRAPYFKIEIYHLTKQHFIDWYGDKEKMVKKTDFSFYLFEDHLQVGRETIAFMKEITDGRILREKISQYLNKQNLNFQG